MTKRPSGRKRANQNRETLRLDLEDHKARTDLMACGLRVLKGDHSKHLEWCKVCRDAGQQ